MTVTVDTIRLELPLRRTFRIARGARDTVDALLLRVEDGQETGWGQACASPAVTGEDPTDTRRQLASLNPRDLDPADVRGTLAAHEDLGPAARAALDLALHDLAGRQQGVSLHEMLELPTAMQPCAATVTLTDPDDAADQALAWTKSGYMRLKVKVGNDGRVLDLVDAVRAILPDPRAPMPEPEVWVDANEALSLDAALELLPELAARDVALLEQPLPRDDTEGLARLLEATEIPIVADESVRRPRDVRALAEIAGAGGRLGVNVKVQKVGGVERARACIQDAREGNLDVMIGCNVETGLGIAAGAALCGAADRVDLDGNLFLACDPFPLPRPMPGHVGTPEGPGLGVRPDPRFERLT